MKVSTTKRSNDNRMLSITAENGVEIQYRLAPVSDCQKKFKKVKNGLKTCHYSSAPRGCILLPCLSFGSVDIRPLQRKKKFRNFLRQMHFWGQYVGPPPKFMPVFLTFLGDPVPPKFFFKNRASAIASCHRFRSFLKISCS